MHIRDKNKINGKSEGKSDIGLSENSELKIAILI